MKPKKVIKSFLKKVIFFLIEKQSKYSGWDILFKKKQTPVNPPTPEYHPLLGWQNQSVDIRQYAVPDYCDEFIARLNTMYELQIFPCPLSPGSEGVKVAQSEYGFEWSLSSSGLLQMSKRFTESSLDLFYRSGDYRKITMGGVTDEHLFMLEHQIMAKYFLEAFQAAEIDIKGKTVFELGCGSGGILLALKNRGAIVTGVDLDDGAIEFGKQYVNNLYSGDAYDFLDRMSFDLIILSNVLEHLHDPVKFLIQLSNSITYSETKVVIDVPNLMGAHSYGDNFNKFLHIAHIWYFTPATLSSLLELAGFKIDFIFDRGSGLMVMCSKAVTAKFDSIDADASFILSVSAINYANNLTHSTSRVEIKNFLLDLNS